MQYSINSAFHFVEALALYLFVMSSVVKRRPHQHVSNQTVHKWIFIFLISPRSSSFVKLNTLSRKPLSKTWKLQTIVIPSFTFHPPLQSNLYNLYKGGGGIHIPILNYFSELWNKTKSSNRNHKSWKIK